MNLFNIFSLGFWIDLLYSLPGMVVGLCFHEFGHAYAAHRMGDDTAKMMGRLTLNPAAHLDPIGTLCLVFLGFGWAKPVPVDPSNYRGNRKVADIIVSLAGITMNLIMAIFSMFLVYFLNLVCGMNNQVIKDILLNMTYINIALMVFNLIPVPPLDGSHVLEDLMVPVVGARPFYFIRQNSMIILLIVLFILNSTGILGYVTYGLAGLLGNLFALIFSGYGI